MSNTTNKRKRSPSPEVIELLSSDEEGRRGGVEVGRGGAGGGGGGAAAASRQPGPEAPPAGRPQLEEVRGDLLEQHDVQYIAHQCNAARDATLLPHEAPKFRGAARTLAGKVFRKFPWSLICLGVPVADCKLRAGKATIHGDGVSQRFVVNLFGQLDKGWGNKQGKRRAAWAAGLRNDHGADDSKSRRLQFFTQALADFEAQALAAGVPLTSVAFPERIGCGVAGGNWAEYRAVIEGFQLRNPRVRVVLVRWG